MGSPDFAQPQKRIGLPRCSTMLSPNIVLTSGRGLVSAAFARIAMNAATVKVQNCLICISRVGDMDFIIQILGLFQNGFWQLSQARKNVPGKPGTFSPAPQFSPGYGELIL